MILVHPTPPLPTSRDSYDLLPVHLSRAIDVARSVYNERGTCPPITTCSPEFLIVAVDALRNGAVNDCSHFAVVYAQPKRGGGDDDVCLGVAPPLDHRPAVSVRRVACDDIDSSIPFLMKTGEPCLRHTGFGEIQHEWTRQVSKGLEDDGCLLSRVPSPNGPVSGFWPQLRCGDKNKLGRSAEQGLEGL